MVELNHFELLLERELDLVDTALYFYDKLKQKVLPQKLTLPKLIHRPLQSLFQEPVVSGGN